MMSGSLLHDLSGPTKYIIYNILITLGANGPLALKY